MMQVVIVGAGGHARSVLEALRSQPDGPEVVGLTDPDPSREGGRLDGLPILGTDECLPGVLRQGVQAACIGVGGTGDNRPRARLFQAVRSLGFTLAPVQHAAALVASNATIGEGTQVLAGAIVGPGASVGADVIVNTGAIVEHDCVVGDHVHLATGCALGGAVQVGTESHVGIRACVLQGLRIGERSIVGGGAVVIRNITDDQIAVGCPASERPRSG